MKFHRSPRITISSMLIVAIAFFVNSCTAPVSNPPVVATPTIGAVTSPPVTTVTIGIEAFVPASGSKGTSVSILGKGFQGATSVKFATGFAASYVVISDTRIQAVVSESSATGKITIITPAGTFASKDDFTFIQ